MVSDHDYSRNILFHQPSDRLCSLWRCSEESSKSFQSISRYSLVCNIWILHFYAISIILFLLRKSLGGSFEVLQYQVTLDCSINHMFVCVRVYRIQQSTFERMQIILRIIWIQITRGKQPRSHGQLQSFITADSLLIFKKLFQSMVMVYSC